MRQLFTGLLLLVALSAQAQFVIGKGTIDGSAIVDFALDFKGGLVLPAVRTIPTGSGASNGTILVNATNRSEVKVQARQNGQWIDLTNPIDLLTKLPVNGAPDILNDVIVGAPTSAASGVLVLESDRLALILPKVTDVMTLSDNSVGTMFYDLKTRSLAVYDGRKWILWK